MTDDTMNVQALLGKSADADFLREMIGFAAQRLMELEVGGLTGAAYGEENPEPLVQRNGYRDTTEAAKLQWRKVADQLRPTVPKLAALMDTADEDVLAYMSFPPQHRTKLHSTNPLERVTARSSGWRAPTRPT